MAVLTDHVPLPEPIAGALEALKQSAQEGCTESGEAEWLRVADAGKTLADSLRSEELRTAAGEDGAVEAIGELLRRVVCLRREQRSVPEESLLRAQTELVRIVGNLCFDHDENRQRTLDAGIPLAMAQLLSSLLECSDDVAESGTRADRSCLSFDEIKFARAATGAVLNSSLKFDPMRRELARKEVLRPLLAMLDFREDSSRPFLPIYRIGEWAHPDRGCPEEHDLEERRDTAATAIRWAANVLEDVLSEDKSAFPLVGIPILASSVLHLRSSGLATSRTPEPEDAEDWIDTDIELLTISTSLLEGIVLDSDKAKSALAFSCGNLGSSRRTDSLLTRLLDFIESGTTPHHWTEWSDDPARTEKAFSAIKASVVRAVVEAPNSDTVMQRLWDETQTRDDRDGHAQTTSWVIERLVRWLHAATAETGREDLLICAAHMLASLGRKDEYTLSLVRDYGLAEPLARIVRERAAGVVGKTGRPGETTQILFGVVSLLRHLAIPVPNREVISETGVTSALAQLLRPDLDVVQPLQLAAVGLLKHLSYPSVHNVLQLCDGFSSTDTNIPALSRSSPLAPVDLVVEIARRVDDTRLRSESARILVNAIRTLFGSASTSAVPTEQEEAIAVARTRCSRADVVATVAELVRSSPNHPMLVNEGVVALALLTARDSPTASLVLDGLLASPPARDKPLSEDTDGSRLLHDRPPPAKVEAGTATAVDAIVELFTRSGSASIPPEMLSNAASLLFTVLLATRDDSAARSALGDRIREPLQQASEREDAMGYQVWSGAVQKVLAEVSQ